MSSNNKNLKDPNLTKEEQEQASAKKAGELAGRTALDYATGGKYEQLRNAPVVGETLKSTEDKIGKEIGELDKATGGKIGKIAKKADDAGALDTADKGLGMFDGKKSGKGQNEGELNASNVPHPISVYNPSTSSPNFSKNGFIDNKNNGIDFDNEEKKSRRIIKEINERQKQLDEEIEKQNKNNYNENGLEEKENPDKKNEVVLEARIEKFAKRTLIIMSAILFLLLLLFIVFSSVYSKNNDLAAVDKDNGYDGYSPAYYANSNQELQDFYERVLEIEEDYAKKGKNINPMYITATYHVLKTHNERVPIKYFSNSKIKKMCEGMLGGSSTYSEANYREYLIEKFFPKAGYDSNESEEYTDEVFEYINEYLEEKGRKNNTCSSVSGGSCEYSFTGVHGLNVGAFSVSNLQVKLMSSSFCNGTDNVALDEELVPFENYILGVTYGEIGEAFNTEVEKVHMIAARSFALARPYIMNESNGVKYINNKSILQLRSCVADQVYCNTEKGCSKDVVSTNQYGVVYSGKTHPYIYKDELSNHPNSTLKSSWETTMGMVGVDKDGKIVEMGYFEGNGNKDDKVWKRWAEQGMDYVQIIMSAYPEVKEIKQFGCNKNIEETENKLLQVASSLWKQIANNNSEYSQQGLSVPPPKGLMDCSTFISWILYEYGFKDEFGGVQHDTVAFLNTNWSEKMGWTEIPVAAGEDVTRKLQPGDILVRDTGTGGDYGHINIIAEVTEDGRVLAYDCGGKQNWNNATARNGKPIENTSFAKTDYRPGKIIRVSNISGNSCKSAESGEWKTWRQYVPAPWAHVPLGNSGLDINGYGCFVTSIAIQIARSGVQTTLSEFNPGTFVQELNKYGSFDNGGNFIGNNNISKIVPSFEIIATGVSLPNNKNEKINTIKSYIDQGYYVLLRVKTSSGQHWVAVTGVTNDGIQMVDPNSNTTMVWDEYPVSESSQINIYKIG